MVDPLHISCGRDVACFYASDKEFQAVFRCLQYEQCAGPQKQLTINHVIQENNHR